VRSAEQSFPARTGSVRAARHFLDEELERWQQQNLQWTAELLLSELTTNVVLHAGTEFTVALLLLPDGAVRIEVTDRVRRAPRERRYDAEATTGRGIALVVHLSRAWGVDKQADGKVVWCELEAESDRVSEGCGPTLALATPPHLVTYRRWYLDNFIAQCDGGPPQPWTDTLLAGPAEQHPVAPSSAGPGDTG